jgi:hypothetical protein
MRRDPVAPVLVLASALAMAVVISGGLFLGFNRSGQPHNPWIFGPLAAAAWTAAYAVSLRALVAVAPVRPLAGMARGLSLVWVLTVPIIAALSASSASASVLRATGLGPLALVTVMAGLGALFMPDVAAALRLRATEGPRSSRIAAFVRGHGFALTPIAAAALMIYVGESLIFGITRIRITHLQEHLPPQAFVANVLLLAGLVWIVAAVTNRLGVGLIAAGAFYATFVLANLIKLRELHAVLEPLDLQYLGDYLEFFRQFYGAAGVALAGVIAVSLLVGLVRSWHRGGRAGSIASRIAAGVTGGLLVAGFACGAVLPPVRASLQRADLGLRTWDNLESAYANGFLVEFALKVPDYVIPVPAGYSADEVIRRYDACSQGTAPAASGVSAAGTNLIVYLVESMVDPQDLGVEPTTEVIPAIRAAAARAEHGRAIVPAPFGGSGNTEFEVLSGANAAFLPERSIIYRQFLRRPFPGLPMELGRHGYRTSAVYVDVPQLYSRGEVVRHLGFDHVVWLRDRPELPLDTAGRYPSDEAVVDAVIAESRTDRPFFVFAFPGSTHTPYNYDNYSKDGVDVGPGVAPADRPQLRTYLTALRAADKAIGRLIRHFEADPRPTVIAILGDHIPPVPGSTFERAGYYRGTPADVARKLRSVPLVIWSNREARASEITISTSLLAQHLLARLGIEPSRFLAVSRRVAGLAPVVSGVIQTNDGRWMLSADRPATLAGAIEDYELIQYDLLIGKRYLAARLGLDR